MRGLAGADSLATKAALETQGLVLSYQGKTFAAMFTRSCGGRTRTTSEDKLPGCGYPYFAVRCDYCRANPVRWTRKLSVQDAATAEIGEAGRLAVNRKLGWKTIPSNSFVSQTEASGIILHGTGQGHGIGLCQRGTRAMADTGADFRTILRYYFPNTTLLNLSQ
jgi:stage II sporulation protein D